jgi:hypothetical protein
MRIRTVSAGLLTLLVISTVDCAPRIIAVGDPAADGARGQGRDDAAGAPPDADFTVVLPSPVEAGAAADAGVVVSEPDCTAAAQQRGNAGCSFFPTQLAVSDDVDYNVTGYFDSCYAVFVVNPGTHPVHLALARGGAQLPLAQVARVPQGAGETLTYAPFDPVAGLGPRQVAMLFLSDAPDSAIACPTGVTPATAMTTALIDPAKRQAATGIGQAFHLTSDWPVVAYQITPYSGGNIYGLTSATLLLPQESWGTNHFASTPVDAQHSLIMVTAGQDGTMVTVRPSVAVAAGGTIPATAAGATVRVALDAGQFVQLVDTGTGMRPAGLSGSVISASKPVSVISGADMFSSNRSISSAQQQILPIEALGNQYVAVKHRNRTTVDESEWWQLVGVADGTTLSYLPAAPPGAPAVIGAGQVARWQTKDPFVVSSQDANHPFELTTYMSGWHDTENALGDPEFVNVPATGQYMNAYTFFTDPTYRETSLVVVRKRGADGKFADVHLGCSATPIAGFQPAGDFQLAWVSLASTPADGDYLPPLAGCDNGRQTMDSTAPFAVTVWGWFSGVSYAYPAGASTLKISNVKPPLIE